MNSIKFVLGGLGRNPKKRSLTVNMSDREYRSLIEMMQKKSDACIVLSDADNRVFERMECPPENMAGPWGVE